MASISPMVCSIRTTAATETTVGAAHLGDVFRNLLGGAGSLRGESLHLRGDHGEIPCRPRRHVPPRWWHSAPADWSWPRFRRSCRRPHRCVRPARSMPRWSSASRLRRSRRAPTISPDCATCPLISRIEALSSSAALATVWALARACPEADAALCAAFPVRAAEALISSAVAVIAAVRAPTSLIALVVSSSIRSTMPIRAACFSASVSWRVRSPPAPGRAHARRRRAAATMPARSRQSDRCVWRTAPHCPRRRPRCDASRLSVTARA